MLSAIAHAALAGIAGDGGEHAGHGLPAGEPFGFQTAIPAIADEPSLAFAQWIIWLPAMSRAI